MQQKYWKCSTILQLNGGKKQTIFLLMRSCNRPTSTRGQCPSVQLLSSLSVSVSDTENHSVQNQKSIIAAELWSSGSLQRTGCFNLVGVLWRAARAAILILRGKTAVIQEKQQIRMQGWWQYNSWVSSNGPVLFKSLHCFFRSSTSAVSGVKMFSSFRSTCFLIIIYTFNIYVRL